MRFAAELITILSAGMFAGGAAYITLVEHPARTEVGTEVAVAEFGPAYRLAARWQGGCALVALGAGVSTTILTREWSWALAAALVGAAVPFTLLAVAPVTRRLMDADSPPGDDTAVRLLSRWGRLHAIRTLLGAAGFVVAASQAIAG